MLFDLRLTSNASKQATTDRQKERLIMASPYVLSYTLLDANQVKTSTPLLYKPDNAAVLTLEGLIADWVAVGNTLDDATNAQIVGGRVTLPLSAAIGWKTAPVDENDVSDVINLNFNNGVTRYVTEFILPQFLQAMVTGGKVDLANVALAALVTALTSGLTGGAMVDRGGNAITDLRDAFQADRKHRRQLRNRSLATP
jgi:hypothetical protein